MRRSVVSFSGLAVLTAVLTSGCGSSVVGSASPASEQQVQAPTTTSRPAPTTTTGAALPANGIGDPEGKFYTAELPSGLTNATKLVSWGGSYHAVLTPQSNPQDNQNYITVGSESLYKGDAAAIEHSLKNPRVIAKDLPPTRYSRKAVDGRDSVVQTIGPSKAPRDPNVTVNQRVYYIPNKDPQGKPVSIRCRWTDTNKDAAKAIDTGCDALVAQLKLVK
ncbi:hypothetical protein [Allokutzneria multivorans]|uniref:hypothetical protein n=1 Tax=Allokutzneria multivorans TaxID=1142134 RepID=UPI0031F123B6